MDCILTQTFWRVFFTTLTGREKRNALEAKKYTLRKYENTNVSWYTSNIATKGSIACIRTNCLPLSWWSSSDEKFKLSTALIN